MYLRACLFLAVLEALAFCSSSSSNVRVAWSYSLTGISHQQNSYGSLGFTSINTIRLHESFDLLDSLSHIAGSLYNKYTALCYDFHHLNMCLKRQSSAYIYIYTG